MEIPNYNFFISKIYPLFTEVLWAVVTREIPAQELLQRVSDSIYSLDISEDDKQRLRGHVQRGGTALATDFSFTELCSIVRCLCPRIQATLGWSKYPSAASVLVGDDVARIEALFSGCDESPSGSMADSELETVLAISEEIAGRIDQELGTTFSHVLEELLSRHRQATNAETEADMEVDQEVPTSEGNGNIEVIADLRLFKTKLLSGSGRAAVFEGRFEKEIPVAIKKIFYIRSREQDVEMETLREVEVLRKTLIHSSENIIRFFKSETREEFVYLAFELCQGTLENYVADASMRSVLPWKAVLRQMTNGLRFLHDEPKIAHRDLKPSNVLYVETPSVLKFVLADFGHSKVLEDMQCSISGTPGTMGWIAPEVMAHQASGNQYSTKSDIFSLGCLFYFVYTNGKHPFGKSPHDQQTNIHSNVCNLDPIPEQHQYFKDLTTDMLKVTLDDRPSAATILLEHPALFEDDVIMDFLHKASNQLENYSPQRQKILESPTIIPGGNWINRVQSKETRKRLLSYSMHKNGRPMFKDKEGSVRHLLKAVRNYAEHFKELPYRVQKEMGPSISDQVNFWFTYFPWLLMHVYKKMRVDPELMKSIRK